MRETEAKKKIGKEYWDEFCRWMAGQTMGIYADGETDFYDCDVEAFVERLKTGYDRQQDPLAWD